MKYKVGDKVKIKSWITMFEEFGIDKHHSINCKCGFVEGMMDWCNEIMTIEEVIEEDERYIMEEDHGIWDWSDDMFEEINQKDVIEEIRKNSSEMKGVVYKHFKGGRYIVTDIALHTEESVPMVIYKNFDNSDISFARPLEMFLSKVDKNKYPDAKQEYRFERVWKDEEVQE